VSWRGIKTCAPACSPGSRVRQAAAEGVSETGVERDRVTLPHRDGSKPRSIDEILQKVEEQTGKEGRTAFKKFLAKVRPTE
jgi:hypothetical protein